MAALWVGGNPRPPRLKVEFTGCREFLPAGPVCEIAEQNGSSRPLRLRVRPLDGTDWQLIIVGGRKKSLPVLAGALLRAEVPPSATSIELEALVPSRPVVWRLHLAHRRLPPWLTDQPPAGDAARAAFVCDFRERLHGVSPELRGTVLWRLMALSPDEKRESLVGEAMAAHRAAGQLLGEVWAGTALASVLIGEHRFHEAHGVLDGLAARLPAAGPLDAQVEVALAYQRGVLARNEGDLRTALRELPAAADLAARLDLSPSLQNAAAQEEALAQQDLGRWPEAEKIFQRLLDSQETAAATAPPRPAPGTVADCQQRGMLLSNYAWSLLMQQESLGGGAEGAVAGTQSRDLLLRARDVFDAAGCDERLDVRVSLALADLQRGDRAGARLALAEADRIAAAKVPRSRPTTAAGASAHAGADQAAARMSPEQRLWRYEIEARLALAEGRPGLALGLYDRLQQLAESTFSPAGRWLAAYGQARAHQQIRDVEAALAAYGRASDLIDEQSLDIPIFEGRETFAALREVGTRAHLDLLVSRGRARDAFAVARRARSRLVRQLERDVRLEGLTAAERAIWQRSLDDYRRRRDDLDRESRDDWQLAADQLAVLRAARLSQSRDLQEALDSAFAVLEKSGRGRAAPPRGAPPRAGAPPGPGALPPPRPGEVVLAYYDLGGGRWVGFAAGPAAVRMSEFSLPRGRLGRLPEARELSRLLLAPFGQEIGRARQVRVLPFGALKEVDFQALPFGGDILLAAKPLVYGLDSAAPPAAPPRRAGPWHALVLGDTRGDLPDARGEAQAVGRALNARDTGWSAEILEGETGRSALDERLDRCDLFHYAGHAKRAAAGSWESMLLLARGSRMTLADLLALPRSPAWVVLAGCDTGSEPAGTEFEVPSLAHAFLLAGARGVIAAVRKIDDRAAHDFSAELYSDWRDEPDLAVRLQRTQLKLRAANPDANPDADALHSYRLFEP